MQLNLPIAELKIRTTLDGSAEVYDVFRKKALTQKTFDQVSAYNLKLNVQYLIISNGLKHYCCRMDYTKATFSFLKDIPQYEALV